MSKKNRKREDWPTEEEFEAEELADEMSELEEENCSGDCASCGSMCNEQEKLKKIREQKTQEAQKQAPTENEKVEEMPKQNEDENAKLAKEYLEMAQRLKAEFDNYRKRNADAIDKAKIEGKKSVLISILPCADVLDMAVKMIKDEATRKGVEMAQTKFQDVLKELGVKKMQSLGQIYNPNFHDVLSSVSIEGRQDGEIVEEYTAGYMFEDGGNILRYAQVIINKK